MSRYRWLLSRMVNALGLRGLIGMCCLAAAALAYQAVLMPLSADLDKAKGEEGTLRQQPRGKAGGGHVSGSGESLESFYRFFPPAASMPDVLDKMYASASSRSIVLEKGEYRLTRERDGRLARYQITLPVRATYPQLRGFIEDVLGQIPSAALESIGFKREAISADAVEAQIRFVVFLKGA